MEMIKKFKSKNNEIVEIYQDEFTDCPREWDNLGQMVCEHNSYNLGDGPKKNFSGPYSNIISGFGEVKTNSKIHIMLPLYLYDHSGITISTTPFNCRFDSGLVGYIFATEEDIKNEYNVEKITKEITEKVRNVLQGEVETYNQFLTGNVYLYNFYKIEKCNLGHEHKTLIDSCGGFYGDDFKENDLFEYSGIDNEWEEVTE